MLDSSLFSDFLKKIQISYTHKEKIQSILEQNGIKNTIEIKDNLIFLSNVSTVQKREFFFKKEALEKKIEEELGKKYSIKLH